MSAQTKRQFFEAVVKELSLDTRDPYTLLFANACALADQRDQLHFIPIRHWFPFPFHALDIKQSCQTLLYTLL